MRLRVLFAAAALLAGCAPAPLTFYVGDPDVGRAVYDSCSLGVMPQGLELARAGIGLSVAVRPWRDDLVVQVRYDVGPGHRVQLAGRELRADLHDGSPARVGRVEAIDIGGPVPEAGYDAWPARRADLRPADLVMDDSPMPPLPTGPRPRMPLRHYWIAAQLQTGPAASVWVTLPALAVDGVPVELPEIRFERRVRWAVLPLNC